MSMTVDLFTTVTRASLKFVDFCKRMFDNADKVTFTISNK